MEYWRWKESNGGLWEEKQRHVGGQVANHDSKSEEGSVLIPLTQQSDSTTAGALEMTTSSAFDFQIACNGIHATFPESTPLRNVSTVKTQPLQFQIHRMDLLVVGLIRCLARQIHYSDAGPVGGFDLTLSLKMPLITSHFDRTIKRICGYAILEWWVMLLKVRRNCNKERSRLSFRRSSFRMNGIMWLRPWVRRHPNHSIHKRKREILRFALKIWANFQKSRFGHPHVKWLLATVKMMCYENLEGEEGKCEVSSIADWSWCHSSLIRNGGNCGVDILLWLAATNVNAGPMSS
jgi:hypothetical protein